MLIVQCDFDDTATTGNVSEAIREVFGPEGWRSMEEEYVSGKYSVEESNIRQFGLIRTDRSSIEDFVLGSVAFRYAFDQFVDYCQRQGIRLAIVSSGLDLYIRPPIEELGLGHLEVYSGRAEVTPEGIKVEYTDPSGAVITRGFKDSYVRHFKDQGHTVIYIGDGLSDFAPAQEADFVIARSALEDHRRENGLPYLGFETFDDVGKHVEAIRQQLGGDPEG